MTATSIEAIVEKLLLDKALQLQTGQLPVVVEEGAQPGSPRYLEVKDLRNRPAWVGLSGGKVRQGILSVIVHWERGQGTVQPLNTAGQVAAHFAAGSDLFAAGVRVNIYQDPDIGSLLTSSSDCQVVVTIPYRVYLAG